MTAVTFVNNGTVATGSTAPAPGWPVCSHGDTIILTVTTKSGTIVAPSDANHTWTAELAQTSGGSMIIAVWSTIANGDESGTLAMTVTGGTSTNVRMQAYKTADGFYVDIAAISTGADSSSGTGFSCTSASLTTQVDDQVMAVTGLTATETSLTSRALTQTGATVGTQTNRSGFNGTTTRQENTDYGPFTAGATNTITFACTLNATAATGITAFIVLRAVTNYAGYLTRFYFPASGAAGVTPAAFGTNWDVVPTAIPLAMPTKKTGTALANVATATETSTSVVNVAHPNQYVSAAIPAQVLAGHFTLVMKVGENASGSDLSIQCVIRVIDSSGVELAVLYSGHTAALTATTGVLGQEMGTTQSTRVMDAISLTPYTSLTGTDRIVVEIGARAHNTTSSSAFGTFNVGDDSTAADFADTQGLTTSLDPYIQLDWDVFHPTTLYTRNVSETVSGTDSVARVVSAVRAVTDGNSTSEAVDRVFNAVRGLSETTSGTDSVARAFTGSRSVSDGSTTSEAPTRAFTGSRDVAETVSGTDSPTRQASFPRAVSETVTGTDSPDRSVNKVRALSETVSGSDSPSRAIVAARAVADTVGGSDSPARAFSGSRSVSETVTGTDSPASLVAIGRSASDTVTGTDSPTRVLSASRALSETVAGTDSVARVFSGSRVVADGNSTSESPTRVFTGSRSVSETTSGVDSPTRSQVLDRQVAETVTGTDAAEGAIILLRDVSETVTGTDAVTRHIDLARSVSEPIPTSETPTRVLALTRAVAETVSGTDSVARSTVEVRLVAETVTGSDSPGRVVLSARAVSETVHGTDATSRQVLFGRSVSETTSGTDSLSTFKHLFRSVAEPLSTSDSPARALTAMRSLFESSTTSDAASRSVAFARAVSEAVTGSDAASSHVIFVRGLFEDTDGTDSPDRSVAYARTVSEPLTTSDLAALDYRLLFRTADDTLTTADDVDAEFLGHFEYGPATAVIVAVSHDKLGFCLVASATVVFRFSQPVERWIVRRASVDAYSGELVVEHVNGVPSVNGSTVIDAGQLLPGVNDFAVYGKVVGDDWGS